MIYFLCMTENVYLTSASNFKLTYYQLRFYSSHLSPRIPVSLRLEVRKKQKDVLDVIDKPVILIWSLCIVYIHYVLYASIFMYTINMCAYCVSIKNKNWKEYKSTRLCESKKKWHKNFDTNRKDKCGTKYRDEI